MKKTIPKKKTVSIIEPALDEVDEFVAADLEDISEEAEVVSSSDSSEKKEKGEEAVETDADKEIRHRAKKLGIKHYWNRKIESLLEEIAEIEFEEGE